MTLLKGKHNFGTVDEVRCTIVEKGIGTERRDFLKRLLEHNDFEVKIGEDKRKKEEDPITYVVGVTDMAFNPVIWVYQRKLKSFDGHKVTPDYWNQFTETLEPNYWIPEKKDFAKGD